MMRRHPAVFLISSVLLLSVACSSPEQTAEKKEEATPLPPRTGREAFQSMFVSARGWQRDVLALQLKSVNLTNVKAGPGQAGAWQAIFVSPGARQARTYTWSAVEEEGNLHKGVFAGPPESWSGPNGSSTPFDALALKIDSDAAYKTAAEKSEDYIRKHPDTRVTYLLEQTNRFPDPAWRVIWGESVSTSDYSVFVDATLGTFLERVKG